MNISNRHAKGELGRITSLSTSSSGCSMNRYQRCVFLALDFAQVGTRLRRLCGHDDEIFETERQARQGDAVPGAERAELDQSILLKRSGADHDLLDAALGNKIDQLLEPSDDGQTVKADPDLPRVVVDEPEHANRLLAALQLAQHQIAAVARAVDDNTTARRLPAIDVLADQPE